ncbi:hypothetical protein BJY04DRAFT_215494 [Aspergillus karnatakaensis]|uniref:uncharacterized protein n=1 Tax=Aspergillus karnatakaensis TaxID=1810916 RepID=UPI003CCCC568
MSVPQTLESIAARSVHIMPNPAPRSLAQSRLILARLQKFGEVVTFRNMKYDNTVNNTKKNGYIVVLFDSPASAQAAVQASPLRITVPAVSGNASHFPQPDSSSSVEAPGDGAGDASLEPAPLTPESKSTSTTQFSNPSSHSSSSSKPPTVTIDSEVQVSADWYSHQVVNWSNPYHGPFIPRKTHSVAVDLSRKLGPTLQALADVPAREGITTDRQRPQTSPGMNRLGAGSLMSMWREVERRERAEQIEREDIDWEKPNGAWLVENKKREQKKEKEREKEAARGRSAGWGGWKKGINKQKVEMGYAFEGKGKS